MHKELYLTLENDAEDSFLIQHIQYNLAKRLKSVKYYGYRRIDITLSSSQHGIEFNWIDKSSANIRCALPKEFLSSLNKTSTIQAIYKLIHQCLDKVWANNNWNLDDLISIFEQVKVENYKSEINYTKAIRSPNKKMSAGFYCEIFPEFANYYIQFHDKANKLLKQECFLKGQPNLLLFFLFFKHYYWETDQTFVLSDLNKEIFFVFDVNSRFNIEYKPRYNSLDECMDYLKAFEAGKTRLERLKLLQL